MRTKKFPVICAMILILALSGCADNATEEMDVNKNTIDFSKVSKVTFLSFEDPDVSKSLYSHEIANSLNDYYKYNWMYEDAFRAYRTVSENSDQYKKHSANVSIDDFIEEKTGHYVIANYSEKEAMPGLTGKYRTMVYNAETGDFWCGTDEHNLVVYNECKIEDFRVDGSLLEIIEGKWKFPEYDNVVEYLCCAGWMGREYTEEELREFEYFEYLESLDE